MRTATSITIVVLFGVLLSEAAAQGGPSPRSQLYVRAGMGMAQLEAPRERFSMRPVAEPSLALGFVWSSGQAVELRGSYLRFETTEEVPAGGPVNEAPTTVSLWALPLEATYQFQPPRLQLGRLRPMVGLGATWMPIRSTWESDVPAEGRRVSAFGATAFLGSAIEVHERASLLTRGGYRYSRRSDAYYFRGTRYVPGLKVTGFFVDVGVQVFF